MGEYRHGRGVAKPRSEARFYYSHYHTTGRIATSRAQPTCHMYNLTSEVRKSLLHRRNRLHTKVLLIVKRNAISMTHGTVLGR